MRLAVEGLVTAGLCLALLCDGALAQSRRPEQISPATPRAEGGNGGGGTGIGARGGIGGGSQANETPEIAAARAAREKSNEELSKCLVTQASSMIRSGERAEIIADSALVFCVAAVRKHAETSLAVLRATYGARANAITRAQMEAEVVRGRRTILIALIVKARTSPGTPLPGTPAAKDKVTPASVPIGEPGPLLKKARDCLDSAGRGTMKAFVADDAKMMAVLDLCRAEIEAYARADFVAKGSPTLEQARTKAFFLAKEHAKKAVTP